MFLELEGRQVYRFMGWCFSFYFPDVPIENSTKDKHFCFHRNVLEVAKNVAKIKNFDLYPFEWIFRLIDRHRLTRE